MGGWSHTFVWALQKVAAAGGGIASPEGKHNAGRGFPLLKYRTLFGIHTDGASLVSAARVGGMVQTSAGP